MSAQPAMFSPGRVLVADGVVYVRELEEPDDEVVRIVTESDDPVAAVGQCLRGRCPGAAGRARHRRRRRDRAVVLRARGALRGPGDRRGRRDRPHHQPVCSTRTTARSPARSPSFHAELDAAARRHVRRRLEVERARQHRGARARHDEGPHHARDRRQPDRPAQDGAGRHRAARGRRRSPTRCAASPSTSASSTPPTRSTSRPPARASTTRTSSTSASARSPPATATSPRSPAKQSGSSASQVGDEVVTLNRDDTHGVEARFTLEMKNRPLNMRKTMAELDEALVQPRRARRDRGVPLAGAGAHVGAVPALRRQGDRGVRPRRRRRLGAAPRLHVGALDRAQGTRGRARRPRSTSSGSRCLLDDAAPRAGASHRDQAVPHPGQARASTRPPTRCATWSARCTRASTPSTPSSAPEQRPRLRSVRAAERATTVHPCGSWCWVRGSAGSS